MNPEPVPDEGTKLILPSMHQEALIDALLGKRREPRQIVLGEQAHKLSVDERRARRGKNKARRRKGTAGRSGRETWLPEAKQMARYTRTVNGG